MIIFLMIGSLNADSIGFNRQNSMAIGHLARRLRLPVDGRSDHVSDPKMQIMMQQWDKNDLELMKQMISRLQLKKSSNHNSAQFGQRRKRLSLMHQLYN